MTLFAMLGLKNSSPSSRVRITLLPTLSMGPSSLFYSIGRLRPFLKPPGRITNLLDIAGLRNRYTDRFDRDILLKDIDWGNVDNSLAREREASEHFVTSIKGDF